MKKAAKAKITAASRCIVHTISVGNTHASATAWDDGKLLSSRTVESNATSIKSLVRDLEKAHDLENVVVSGVVPKRKSALIALLDSQDIPFQIFRKDLVALVEIVPDPPERVGDDRIAGALGALALDSTVPWVVVDCGTAITCNAVTPAANGKLPRFEGGLIAPGTEACLKALSSNTAQLPQLAPDDCSNATFIGLNTEQAMLSGVAVLQTAGILAMIEGQRSILGPQTKVVLTGGGATAFRDALRHAEPRTLPFEFHPALVHLGLYSAWKAARP